MAKLVKVVVEKKEEPKLLKTTELTFLESAGIKFTGENRVVDRKHVSKLKASISEENRLHVCPIVVNTKGELIDGQHRLTAAMELGLDKVPCLVVLEHTDAAAAINQNMKNWSGPDFAHYWAKKGLKDYVDFLAFVKRTGTTFSVAISLLTGEMRSERHLVNFKKGLFRIRKVEQGDWITYVERFVARTEEFRPFLKDGYRDRSFILAFWHVFNSTSYNHEHMMKKVEMVGLTRKATQEDYRQQLEDVYNWKVRVEDKIYFR